MADDEPELIGGVWTHIIRLQERMKQTATREEVGNTYTRMLQEVSTIFERTNAVQREYVRDRVRESALETKGAIDDSESHLKEDIGDLKTAVAGLTSAMAAVAVQLQQIQSQPTENNKRGWHPVGVGLGGVGLGGSFLYLILALLGIVPHPG